jgi:hypothetical protein
MPTNHQVHGAVELSVQFEVQRRQGVLESRRRHSEAFPAAPHGPSYIGRTPIASTKSLQLGNDANPSPNMPATVLERIKYGVGLVFHGDLRNERSQRHSTGDERANRPQHSPWVRDLRVFPGVGHDAQVGEVP